MAENIPNVPGGALPPKKETGKVQPKKETVRINLPPKPSAAPTIKLPTLPPGAAAGAPPSAAAPAPALSTSAAAPVAAPRATAAPAAAAPRPVAAAAPTQMPRPVSAPAPVAVSPGLTGLDFGLAITAAVVGLIAIGSTAWLAFFLLQ